MFSVMKNVYKIARVVLNIQYRIEIPRTKVFFSGHRTMKVFPRTAFSKCFLLL